MARAFQGLSFGMTGDLALIGTLAALTVAASSVAQVVAQRRRGSSTQRLQAPA